MQVVALITMEIHNRDVIERMVKVVHPYIVY
jgi:hypothetical protein